MKKNVLFSILLLNTFFLPMSCQKNETIGNILPLKESSLLESAREWFNQSYGVSALRINNEKNAKTPDWSKGKSYKFAWGDAVIVPITYQKPLTPKYFINKEKAKKDKTEPKFKLTSNDLDYLLIKKDSKGSFYERVVKIIPDEDYLIKSNGRKKVVPFDGLMNITDWNDKLVDGFKYEKGKVVGRLNTLKNGRVLDLICETIDWYTCATCDGCDEWYCTYSYSETNCYNSGPSGDVEYPDPNNPNGGGGGDGSSGGNGGGVEPQQIVNNLSNPCYSNTLTHLLNSGIIDNQVIAILRNFQNNQNIQVTYQNQAMGGRDPDGITHGRVVTLNDDALRDASKEFIAVTILHETLHVYLKDLLNQMTYEADHNKIANDYINPIANALSSIYGISWTDAEALAWGGLQKTSLWAVKTSVSPQWHQDVLYVNAKYKNHNNQYNHAHGTRCD